MGKQPAFRNVQEELAHLRELLRLEHQAEVAYYREKILAQPLAKRQERGLTWYPVQITHTRYLAGERLALDLQPPEHAPKRHAFQAGQVVALFSYVSDDPRKNPQLHGVVARVREGIANVVLGTDHLPQWVGEGRLGLDVYFDETTYREMEKGLRRMEEAAGNRTADLRDTLLGYCPPSLSENPRPVNLPALNASQNAAIEHVLRAEDVAVIHGPPGTGKTTTLVEAIRLTLKTEPQVLVCAPSNTAVDVLAERLDAKGVRVLRLGHPVRVSDNLQALTVEEQIRQHRDYPEYRRLKREAEQLRQQALKFKRTYNRGQRRRELEEVDDLRRQARTLEDYIQFDLLKSAEAIACTLVGSTLEVLGGRRFRTVFIDEAAQALTPACFLPALRADRVVFAGDPFQLPPTVKSKEAEKRGFAVSLMEAFMDRQPKPFGELLKVQYRMHAEIMGFSNQQFYGGELEAAPSVARHSHIENAPGVWANRPLEFLDTAGCGFTETQHPETLSRYNEDEARLLIQHLHSTLEDLALGGLVPGSISVGLLAPYAAQVDRLRELFAISQIENTFPHRYHIGTVDGFQGQEVDLLGITFTRSNEQGDIGFLKDTRRTNVALTRARKKLLLVGDSATLAAHPFYEQLVDYLIAHDAHRTAWEVINA